MDPSITKALEQAGLLTYFLGLTPSHQHEYLKWINSAKKSETKDKRTAKMIKMLNQK
jgi:uncharacterized protein YdeI (YjbR/CyaY-like superfamily)